MTLDEIPPGPCQPPGLARSATIITYLMVVIYDEFQLPADHSVSLNLFFLVWSRSIAWRLGFESSFLCCGRILKSRMVNVLHDKSQSLLIQTRQPQSVSRLYIHFQLCPERHVCCKAFFFFLYMTFRDFKRLQLNPAFTNSKPFPTARSDTPANIPQLQSSSLAA